MCTMSEDPDVPQALAVDAEGSGGDGGGGGGGGEKNSNRRTTFKELEIARRATRNLNVPVYTAGTVVAWQFTLKAHDVNFGVAFVPVPTAAGDESGKDAGETVNVVETVRRSGV